VPQVVEHHRVRALALVGQLRGVEGGIEPLPEPIRQEIRRLLAKQGGLPWAAFPNGNLPDPRYADPWWQTAKFAESVEWWRWHAELLAYRDRWEQPPELSPQQAHLILMRNEPHLRPETRAILRTALRAGQKS
jgi:hypothetical protein